MNQILFENLKLNSFLKLKKESVLLIGKFETFHLGHQKLIYEAIEYANKNNLDVNILIYSKFKFTPIFTLNSRINYLNQFNFNNVILFEPTIENYQITIKQFVEIIKNKLNTKSVFVGSDFTFNKQDNDLDVFSDLIDLHIVDVLKINNVKISSELIKSSLELSELDLINNLLGRNYFYEGRVITGNQNGSKIGFPTANVKLEQIKAIDQGIYVSFFIMDNKKYPSVTSIYTNDTILKNNKELFYETYILNFKDLIYGKKVKVELIEKIREPKMYPNVDELIKAIKKDVNYSIAYFKNNYLKNN